MREEELKNAKQAGVEAKVAELAELKGKLGASLKAYLVQMQEQIQQLEQLPAADEKSERAGTDNADEPPEYHRGRLSNRGWLSYRSWRDMYERIEPLQAGCPDRLPSAIEVALAEWICCRTTSPRGDGSALPALIVLEDGELHALERKPFVRALKLDEGPDADASPGC
jgi:hypothetical protein